MSNVFQVQEPVTAISVDDEVIGQIDHPVQPAEERESEEPAEEYDELPLSDFERDMVRLQKKESADSISSIISQLEDNYARERENIYNSGFEAGMESGKKDLQAQFQEDIQALKDVIQRLGESQWKLRKEAELSLMNLALQIAQHVIKAEIALSPEKITGVVKEALDYTRNLEIISLEMNPEDFSYLQEHSRILDEFPDNVRIKKDGSISRGGCVVHTNMETIDAKVETKLEQLAEELYTSITEEG